MGALQSDDVNTALQRQKYLSAVEVGGMKMVWREILHLGSFAFGGQNRYIRVVVGRLGDEIVIASDVMTHLTNLTRMFNNSARFSINQSRCVFTGGMT